MLLHLHKILLQCQSKENEVKYSILDVGHMLASLRFARNITAYHTPPLSYKLRYI